MHVKSSVPWNIYNYSMNDGTFCFLLYICDFSAKILFSALLVSTEPVVAVDSS